MKVLNSKKWFQFATIITVYVSVVNSAIIPDASPLKNDSTLPLGQDSDKKLLKNQEEENLPQFALDDPELFHNLTHNQTFFTNCSNLPERMENLYNSSKLLTLDSKGFNYILREALNIWNESNIPTYIKYEDLFAIMHYTANGYMEMKKDSDETRRMKNAIYRLAIMQSLDSEEYETELYRGETKPLNWYENQFNKSINSFVFQNFTSTSTERYIATIYSAEDDASVNQTKTIYEMSFTEPFLRADVTKFSLYWIDEERILLPGTKFVINEIKWRTEDGRKVGLTVNLTHNYGNKTLLDHQRQVMRELKKLQNSGTQFYVC